MENKFGSFLQQKRKEKHLTVRSFADSVGISPSFLCDLESGARSFPSKSKKPDLEARMIDVLGLVGEDADNFHALGQDSMLGKNRMSPDMAVYLQNAPKAQEALRKAKEVNASDEDWARFLKSLEKKK